MEACIETYVPISQEHQEPPFVQTAIHTEQCANFVTHRNGSPSPSYSEFRNLCQVSWRDLRFFLLWAVRFFPWRPQTLDTRQQILYFHVLPMLALFDISWRMLFPSLVGSVGHCDLRVCVCAFTVLRSGSWLVNDPQSGVAISYEQPAIKPYSIGVKEMIETRNNASCDLKKTETYEADILIFAHWYETRIRIQRIRDELAFLGVSANAAVETSWRSFGRLGLEVVSQWDQKRSPSVLHRGTAAVICSQLRSQPFWDSEGPRLHLKSDSTAQYDAQKTPGWSDLGLGKSLGI